MRILAFSDVHASAKATRALVAAAEGADLVIGAGDFCNARQGLREAMAGFAAIAAPFVMVPGNAESAEELRDAAPDGAVVLHGEGCELGELKLFGLGYGVPETPFGAWSCDLGEADAAAMLAGCEAADILITHSPPKDVADRTSTGVSVGSVAIREAIERVQPRLALCGHVHDCWGERGRIGKCDVVNLGPVPNWFEM
ncbi:metallophosphoesterase family protein [Marimonas lutisalis]|uniref:metallophosphoesterase family protein n=1 Tax=Marimonas lutisalis TaxID=2545756 RepID=UPI0010F892C0|nr:metallophosphoesterase family protein [Marimonas lutisalis]